MSAESERVSVLSVRKKTKPNFTAQKQEQIEVIQKYLLKQFHNSGKIEALGDSNNENVKKVKHDKRDQRKPLPALTQQAATSAG